MNRCLQGWFYGARLLLTSVAKVQEARLGQQLTEPQPPCLTGGERFPEVTAHRAVLVVFILSGGAAPLEKEDPSSSPFVDEGAGRYLWRRRYGW